MVDGNPLLSALDAELRDNNQATLQQYLKLFKGLTNHYHHLETFLVDLQVCLLCTLQTGYCLWSKQIRCLLSFWNALQVRTTSIGRVAMLNRRSPMEVLNLL
jgi:hypothetical protein